MSVKTRIKEIAKFYNMTISSFESSINASNGYVNSISKSIGLDKMTCFIEKYPNIDVVWLLTGNGEMLLGEKKTDLDVVSAEEILDHIIINTQKFKEEPKMDAVTTLFSNFEQQRELKKMYAKIDTYEKLLEKSIKKT